MLTTEQAKLFQIGGKYDVVVVGGGPGGIGAAVSAARSGKKVALIEQYGFAGGTGTLCCCPIYFGLGYKGKQITAGLADEIIRRLDQKNAACFTTNNYPQYPDMQPIGNRELTNIVISDTDSMRVTYYEVLNQAGVDCLFYSYFTDVVVDGDEIKGILLGRIEGPSVIYGDYFIDATGDALLVHHAGGETREYSSDYNMHKSLFFDMCNVGTYDLEFANKRYKELRAQGEVPENCLDFYMHTEERIPGVTLVSFGKTSGDALTSAGMSEMEQNLRFQQREIADFMRKKMPGFQNAETCFTSIRVGVRAGRGIVGIDTVSEEKVFSDYKEPCPIAFAEKVIGDHSNKLKFNPDWSRNVEGLAAIPMGSLISKSFKNVLACGRDISAEPSMTRIYRMMATCLTTGQAAGLIADLCLEKQILPRELDYALLRERMLQNNFILEV